MTEIEYVEDDSANDVIVLHTQDVKEWAAGVWHKAWVRGALRGPENNPFLDENWTRGV